MKLKINNRDTEFILENEKNSFDVINSIIAWGTSQGKSITRLMLNDAKLDLENLDKAVPLPLDEINEIIVELSDINALVLESLFELQNYLSRFEKELSRIINREVKLDAKSLSQLSEGIVWIQDVITKIQDLIKIEKEEVMINNRTLSSIMSDLESIKQKLSKASYRDAVDIAAFYIQPTIKYLKETGVYFMKRYFMESTETEEGPASILKKIREKKQELSFVIKIITDTTVSLQRGEDSVAMEKIIELTTTLEGLVSLIYKVKSILSLDYSSYQNFVENIESKNSETVGLLKDMVESFENNDMVRLGDILEYELVPLIQSWISVFGIIEKELEKNIH